MRLGYIEAFVVKNHCLYKCTNCSNFSEVCLKDGVCKLILIMQILSVIILFATMFFGGILALMGLLVDIIILGVFYGISPCIFDLDVPKTVQVPEKMGLYHNFLHGKSEQSTQKTLKDPPGNCPSEDKVETSDSTQDAIQEEKQGQNKDPTQPDRDLFSS